MKYTLPLLVTVASILFISSVSAQVNVGSFYGSTDGSLSTDLQLGNRPPTNSPNFKFNSEDASGKSFLTMHAVRYGAGFSWTLGSATGPKKIGYLYGDGAGNYFQLFNEYENIKIELNPGGDTFFNGGNVGIGTSTPATPLDLQSFAMNKGLQIGANGKSTKVKMFVADDDYGYLNLGGNTILRGNDEKSHFQGYLGVGTIPDTPLDIISSLPFEALQIGAVGKSTKIRMFVSSGDYGYLTLGGNTILRGEGQDSHFQGNLGVGTTTPQTPLEIISTKDFDALQIGALGKSTKIRMFVAAAAEDDYGYLNLGGTTTLRGNGEISHFQGQLGVGTTTMGPHMLAVHGSIGAREIKVETTTWYDFVFDDDYQLPSLKEVEDYIDENNHLPEIPSEAEVLENGINLGEMNANLLKKIEEITLYLIEQNKKIEELQKEVVELKKN